MVALVRILPPEPNEASCVQGVSFGFWAWIENAVGADGGCSAASRYPVAGPDLVDSEDGIFFGAGWRHPPTEESTGWSRPRGGLFLFLRGSGEQVLLGRGAFLLRLFRGGGLARFLLLVLALRFR